VYADHPEAMIRAAAANLKPAAHPNIFARLPVHARSTGSHAHKLVLIP
jgi:hypothetical protein